ncbi:MAG TPA: hypothetical protein VM577_18380 [Anaerovoracaceae bacterium]|nr:hypothetical protein [Anaerovoracaceae bacterium]
MGMTTSALNTPQVDPQVLKAQLRPELPKSVYVVSRNADQIEGRGADVPVAVFFSESQATALVNHLIPIYLGATMKSLLVYETFEQYLATEQKEVAKQALRKLSEAEIKALVSIGLLKP